MSAMHDPPHGKAEPPAGRHFSSDALSELAELRVVSTRLRLCFAVPVTGSFLITVLLGGTADGVLAVRLPGGLSPGMLLGLLQGILLLATAWRYDRLAGRDTDPRAAALRQQAEEPLRGFARSAHRAAKPR